MVEARDVVFEEVESVIIRFAGDSGDGMTPSGLTARLEARRPPPPPKPEMPEWRKRLVGRDETGKVMA